MRYYRHPIWQTSKDLVHPSAKAETPLAAFLQGEFWDGNMTVAQSGVASAAAFGLVTVSADASVDSNSVASAAALGSATVSAGASTAATGIEAVFALGAVAVHADGGEVLVEQQTDDHGSSMAWYRAGILDMQRRRELRRKKEKELAEEEKRRKELLEFVLNARVDIGGCRSRSRIGLASVSGSSRVCVSGARTRAASDRSSVSAACSVLATGCDFKADTAFAPTTRQNAFVDFNKNGRRYVEIAEDVLAELLARN